MIVENRYKQFKQEVFDCAEKIGVSVKEIHIRKMKHKWASCSTRGRLTFDPDLLQEAQKKKWEAVIHELLHLRYPNHGRMFNIMLKTYLDRIV